MSQWRVTAEQPLRDVEGLDHERCAALHNLIIERGWTASGRSLSDLDRRSWWECYGGDAQLSPHAAKLSPSLIAFLQAAWHGYALTAQPEHALFRYFVGLSSPDQLWENANYGDDEDDSNKRRYVTLYTANWTLGSSHPLGLVFDQDMSTAMQHMSIHDTSVTMNGRQVWLSLELILEAFLDMMDQGKALAVDSSYDGEQERTAPWVMPSCTERDLEETLEAFDRLTRAIEARMPGSSCTETHHLGDILTSSALSPDSFAGRFLAQAPEVRFRYIAPGLRIARHQPFSSINIEEGKMRPVLLFESSQVAHQDTRPTPWGEDVVIPPFPPPFQEVASYPAGVYLTETDPHGAHPFEDGCVLILPYAIGENGWARTSDGALFGEDTHARGPIARPAASSSELYQQGFNHFIQTHDVQLKHVLERWAEMVEGGRWAVDGTDHPHLVLILNRCHAVFLDFVDLHDLELIEMRYSAMPGHIFTIWTVFLAAARTAMVRLICAEARFEFSKDSRLTWPILLSTMFLDTSYEGDDEEVIGNEVPLSESELLEIRSAVAKIKSWNMRGGEEWIRENFMNLVSCAMTEDQSPWKDES
ncbi:hypothetical protein CCMA1212_007238 [Trichoderma ghanense]|uniref:Uncharacterized protein n=1 Tax=Trichoderma ghanense TaxID=65468 RepID=A0ABY2GZT9_9HYPO